MEHHHLQFWTFKLTFLFVFCPPNFPNQFRNIESAKSKKKKKKKKKWKPCNYASCIKLYLLLSIGVVDWTAVSNFRSIF